LNKTAFAEWLHSPYFILFCKISCCRNIYFRL